MPSPGSDRYKPYLDDLTIEESRIQGRQTHWFLSKGMADFAIRMLG
jgi:hypothetical protein